MGVKRILPAWYLLTLKHFDGRTWCELIYADSHELAAAEAEIRWRFAEVISIESDAMLLARGEG